MRTMRGSRGSIPSRSYDFKQDLNIFQIQVDSRNLSRVFFFMPHPTIDWTRIEFVTCNPGTEIFDGETGEILRAIRRDTLHVHRGKCFLTHDTFEKIEPLLERTQE